MPESKVPYITAIKVNGTPPLGLAKFELGFIAEDVGYKGKMPGTRKLDLLDDQSVIKGQADVLSVMTNNKKGKTYVVCRVLYFKVD